jgi:2,3-bisphosphoglycerate-independent phosphoglycerate mutase
MVNSQAMIRGIARPTDSKIVLLVIDGLGGLPLPETGLTELETARTPNLDRLATGAVCGLIDPVAPGITPGSAPGHLALFGYDPVGSIIGRGALEALGIDFELQPGDVAARGNFATVDGEGVITDRRAGRLSTEQNSKLTKMLDGQTIDGVEVIVHTVKEHRLAVIFRGQGLTDGVTDSDPQQAGVTPAEVAALNQAAQKTAAVANKFLAQAGKILADHHPANMVLLRGFSGKPNHATMAENYKLKAAAIASYPMYRGLARVVGMDVLPTGASFEEEIETLKQNYDKYSFFFVHIKAADEAGEDGDFAAKVAVLEQIDGALEGLTGLAPDVLVITGDHSTPARLKGHSWHPVPLLISSQWCRPDSVKSFSESACISGGLGRLPAKEIMPLAMANALKLNKFGA